MIDRGGTSLEIPADAAELRDELRGLGDGVVGFGVFIESLDQLRVFQIVASVFSEIAVGSRVFLEVIIIISVFVHGRCPFERCFSKRLAQYYIAQYPVITFNEPKLRIIIPYIKQMGKKAVKNS